MPYLEPRGTSMERRWGRKKKKKMFFSKNPTISEGEGGKLGALGEVIQAKKKKLYAGLLHDSEGALWDSRC